MNKPFDVIATLGPSASTLEQITALRNQGVTVVRINGAHNCPESMDKTIKRIKAYELGIKIMVDLPGNKIRVANLEYPIKIEKGKSFRLESSQVNYNGFFKKIKKGAKISAYDSRYTFELMDVEDHALVLKSDTTGVIENNKGLHIDSIQDEMNFVFEKDRRLINVALDNEIDYLAISFVRRADDIRDIKEIIGGRKIHLISKVETRQGVENIEDITREVDTILIDRGDLSSAVGLLDIVACEEEIVKKARGKKDVKIWLATQFLTTMLNSPIPSIAEVFSLHKVISEGIDGIQLSEETAVGEHGCKCVQVILDVYKKLLSVKTKQVLQLEYV